ncbi:MAG: TolC family protein [Bacteroidota bacterium]
MKYIISVLTLLSTLTPWRSEAQATSQQMETLTLEEAIALALENNQSIRIEEKIVEIAESNVYPANADLLPTISLLGSAEYQNNDIDGTIRTFQENPPTASFSDGSAATTTYTATLQADYVLLGGFTGKYRYEIIKDQRDQAYLQQQALINQTIVTVSDLFLEIAKLQSQEELLEKNVRIGEDRLKRVEDQLQFGRVTGLAVLRAKTDLNQDLTALDQVLVAKNNLKRDLNFLIGLDAETRYRVSVTYQPPALQPLEQLKDDVRSDNPEIQLERLGVKIADQQIQLNEADRLPKINAFANYNYFDQENDLQQLAELQTRGFTLGVGLRYNLFSGGRTNRNIQQARLNQEASQYRKQQTEDRILAEAVKEQNNLNLLNAQLAREEENIDTFRESYTRTEERFYNGKETSLDLRDAQNALLNAEVTINNLKADIMKTSLRLEALKGRLLTI